MKTEEAKKLEQSADTIYIRMEKLAQKVSERCREIDRKSIEHLIESITSANYVFLIGAGRSGLAARAFAMRLMHLGLHVHVVGETTTPAIKKGDLLIAITGSGKTGGITNVVRTAKDKEVKIAVITSFPDSPVGKMADIIVRIKGRMLEDEVRGDYTARKLAGEHEPVIPLGTLFELSTMLFLDIIIEELMRRKNLSEEQMRTYHTNLE